MEWPYEYRPIEILRIDVDKHIKEQKPKNIEQLYTCVQKAWNSIPASRHYEMNYNFENIDISDVYLNMCPRKMWHLNIKI